MVRFCLSQSASLHLVGFWVEDGWDIVLKNPCPRDVMLEPYRTVEKQI